MTETTPRLLPLAAAGPGYTCCAPADHGAPAHRDGQHSDRQIQAPSRDSRTASFQVSGMTCGHCSASVTEELSAVEGIAGIWINLVPGGLSTVSVVTDRPVPEALIRSAVKKAGYTLTRS